MIIITVIINIPKWLEYKFVYVQLQPGVNIQKLVKRPFAQNKIYWAVYHISHFYILLFIIPFLLLVFMTVSLIRALQQTRKRHEDMTSQGGIRSRQDDLTLSLITVIIAFICCQTLLPIHRILTTIFTAPSARECGGPLFYFEPFVVIAMLMNSSINFIIYILISKRFRLKFKMMFKIPKWFQM